MRSALEKQDMLATIDREMQLLEQDLVEARLTEKVNRVQRLGYDVWGNSLAVLHVTVHGAKDLPRMDMFSGSADPFVTVELAPTSACPGTTIQRTETKWGQVQPTFEHDFTFKPIVSRDVTIRLSLMDDDKVGDPDFVAQVDIKLSDLVSQEWIGGWHLLLDPEGRSGAEKVCGSLNISAKFFYSRILPLEMAMEALTKEQEALLGSLTNLNQFTSPISANSQAQSERRFRGNYSHYEARVSLSKSRTPLDSTPTLTLITDAHGEADESTLNNAGASSPVKSPLQAALALTATELKKTIIKESHSAVKKSQPTYEKAVRYLHGGDGEEDKQKQQQQNKRKQLRDSDCGVM